MTLPPTITRRTLLRLAGGAGGAAVLGACTARASSTPSPLAAPVRADHGDRLVVTTSTGLSVIDTGTGRSMLPAPGILATADWRQIIAARPDGTGTQLTTYEAGSGSVLAGSTLRDRLEPRVVSGRLVALTTPAPGGAAAQPYRPAPRTRTTIVVADNGGERVRYDLPGNLEPEAFSPDGAVLYVLDYLPPTNPDGYRVRLLDLATGGLQPLLNKGRVPLAPGTEEQMRGTGRQAVLDAGQNVLFTLYSHQGDHLHTRQLVRGVRPDAPHIHAFVHSLFLTERFAVCIDLPAPFGLAAPGGHAITMTPDGQRLYVIDAANGNLAHLSPRHLDVREVTRFAEPGLSGDATVRATPDNGIVVSAGNQVVPVPPDPAGPRPAFGTDSAIRGLAVTPDGQQVYLGQDGAVVLRDLASARELRRVPVPGLVRLEHVTFA